MSTIAGRSCGRIGRTLPVEGLAEIPAVAVARALEAWVWAEEHGRDHQESMLRARTAFRMSSPEHGRSLGQAFHGQRNTRCLVLFQAAGSNRLAMRAALEHDVALGVEEAAEERRHAKAREQAAADARARL